MNTLFDPGREGILDETIKASTNDIRAMLVLSTYTFSAAHKFLTDLGAVDNGRSVALTAKTFAAGVFDAADSSLAATAASACKAIVLFQHTGLDTTARVIAYIDGRVRVQMAAAAALNAVAITSEDLPDGIASGAVLSLISGSGPATITTSASAVTGARSLSVTALSGALSADAIYEYAGTSATGLPFTPAMLQNVSLVWDNTANKIFKL